MKSDVRMSTEFKERFPAEEACRAYWMKARWPMGIACPRCENKKMWPMKHGLYLCSKCRHQMSIFSGTALEDTRKPLRLWFQAMGNVIQEEGRVNALKLQRALGIGSYRTAWTWLRKIQDLMILPETELLTGTVEIDVVRFRENLWNAIVFVAVETRQDGLDRVRLHCMPNASPHTIAIAGMAEALRPGCIVRTRELRGYDRLKIDREKFQIKTVKDRQNVFKITKQLRDWISKTTRMKKWTRADQYLNEFAFRFNGRNDLFFYLIQKTVIAQKNRD